MASEMFPHLKIPLEDVVKATNNFHPDNIIGHGDFGPAYKGQLEWSGKLMTITARRLDRTHGLGGFEFWTEISTLSDLNHTNIVSIIGFCDEKDEQIIITTYEANGSLGQFLDSPNLAWTERLRICVGTARALSYLHSGEGRGNCVIHCFINSSTILLDENWEAKLSGFEISNKQSVHQMDRVVLLSEPIGTTGYMDPAIVKTGGVTPKSDIYSFGIVLFEILCGRKAYIPNGDNIFLDSFAKYHYENNTLQDIIHPDLCNQMSPQSLKLYSEVAYSCLEKEPSHRPDMDYVYTELKKALEAQTRREKLVKKLEHLEIHLKDIKLATENFSETYVIGYEAYCTLYVAQLDHFDNINPSSIEGKNKDEPSKRNNIVVIKRMNKYADREEFLFTEIEMLITVKHNNIATLLGYCLESDEMILVTNNIVSNGYLSQYLGEIYYNDRRALTWEKRLKICIDVAKALSYLHYDMEDNKIIINLNLSNKNIGLDENWVAKITEFGFSAFLPPDQVDEGIHMRYFGFQRCYTDPEHENTMKVKRESDVYSFGVILFEILCGRMADDPIYLRKSFKGLADVARKHVYTGTFKNMIDPIIMEETYEYNCIQCKGPNKDSLHTFIKIANQCVTKAQNERPTMKVVVEELEKALSLQVDRAQHPDIKNALELQLTHESIPEEGVQDVDADEHELTVQKMLKSELMHINGISGKNEHLRIHLDDIKHATDNFSDASMLSYDQYYFLYRVKLHHFNIEYPIYGTLKRIRPEYGGIYTEENCYKDIEVLSSVKHPNIVTLLGFCVEGSEKILLMDDVSNGQLSTCLDDINEYKNILTWEKRLKICIDLAHALNYLHCKIEDRKKIVNHSICSNMIGLDENWRPKIIEFGFSTCLLPYPLGGDNALFNILKRETDVYDFGVLVFEILCGRKANDPVYRTENVNGLADAARCGYNTGTLENMIDPIIKGETCENNFVLNRGPNKNSLNTFIKIALKCVAEYQWERPKMEFVVKELEKALYLQQNNKDNPIISLEDIKIATKNFKDCIGGGGFGNVYIGNLQDGDGRFKTIVAKQLNKMSDQGEKQFLTELQLLLEYKHENVIGLVGYCNEMDEKIIVYEYAPKGSLDKYLGDASLTWIKRLNICIDVATALDFLHGGAEKQAKVIHRDIKSENILLNDDWKAKLADFGLSLISPLTRESDSIIEHWCGTPGYMDPLYHKSRLLTIESDIYSFGVVLFEIMCGKSTFAINKHEGHYLPDFIKRKYEERKLDKVVFEPIREQILPESLAVFQEIAYQCLELKREKRPTMKEVLRELKNALEFQNMASTITKCAPFKIPLEDVLKGTNNFHQDNIIGHGRFGSLYKGRLLLSGNLVNITARRLDRKHGLGDLEFWTEVAVLFDLKHTNLVSIIGFCNAKDEKIILTTYEVNGNLRRHLKSSNLTWKQRLMICVGVARALSYLHHDDGRCERDYYIIHRIINSGTILLDENWEAKLSCFEYFIKHPYKDQFRLYEPIDVMGYMDPSIERMGGVAHKSDVYSFGVVLFEILCGREAHIPSDPNMFLAPLARSHYENEALQEIILPGLWDQMSQQSLHVYSRAAYSCLEEEPAQRPEMYHIVAELEKALSLQNMASTITKCAHLQIPLEDVLKATNNFHHDNIIGHGGIGALYIGQLLRSGNLINITAQRLDRENGQRDLAFWTEVTVLSDLMHTNLVSFIGFWDEKDEKIIIASYEANGSLRKHLNNPNVTWIQRLRVCVGVARALSYLHYSKGRDYAIIHRIINSSTILVDENWEAKLSSFEFSIKQLYNDQVCFYEPIGTPWYIDPSVEKTGGVTHKSDIYSFGVVLFEILCGREAYIESEPNTHLTPLARYHYEKNTLQDIILPDLWNTMSPQSLLVYSNIAYSCLAEEPAHRPDVDYIVAELEKALSLQLNPEVKSDYVEENTHVSITETHVVKLSGELNNMTMTGESGKSEHHNKEKISLPDQTNDSLEYSGCCWSCGFRKIKNLRKAATPSRPDFLQISKGE